MKSWGPLSRHETAEGGRGPARPARRMPGLSSHRVYGRMSESSIEIPRSSPVPAGHPGELAPDRRRTEVELGHQEIRTQRQTVDRIEPHLPAHDGCRSGPALIPDEPRSAFRVSLR